MGAEAGEFIYVFVVMMQAGASARALVDWECVHPTLAEGFTFGNVPSRGGMAT